MFSIIRSKIHDQALDDIGTSVFAVSRFLAAIALWKGFKARYLLLICFLGSVVFPAAAMKTGGVTSVVFTFFNWLTFAPIFPIIFAISLRGTGVHAKTASACLATAVGSGTFAPLIRYAAFISVGNPTSTVITLAFTSAGTIFPLYLNLVPAARRQVDPIKDEYVH